ncbi:MAG: hypothetical protein V1878_01140 [bacterium]
MGLCPLQEDEHRSFSLEAERGLWYCLSCRKGGTIRDLAQLLCVDPPPDDQGAPSGCFIYHNGEGNPLYRNLYTRGEGLRSETYIGEGRWRRGIRFELFVPYRLPGVISAQGPVFLVEGEKEAEALCSLGLVATSVPGGLGLWIEEYHRYFQGKKIVLLPGHRERGPADAEEVAGQLWGVASEIRTVDLPEWGEGGDVTDWLHAGHSKEELLSLLDSAPLYEGPAAQGEERPALRVVSPLPSPPPVLPVSELRFPPFPESAWVGLLDPWRRLVGPTTEAPDAYLFAVFVAGLGLYLGRAFYLCHPRRVFQNYYFLIVGESGLTRKSTAIGYGMDLCGRLDGEIKFSSGVASAEGVLGALAKERGTRKIVFNDEMRILFANAKRPGTQNILSSLNSLYEMRGVLTIDRKDPLEVKEGMFSMISATTADWMTREQEIEAAYGGFINRHLCLVGEAKGPIAIPKPPEDSEWDRQIQGILEWRAALPREGGQVLLGPAAARFYTDWYEEWYQERRNLPETTGALLRRVDGHVVKLSAFYALINSRMQIEREDVERAIGVVDHSSACCRVIFKDVTLSRQARLQERIQEFLAAGPLTRRQLQKKLDRSYDREETDRALGALRESGEIWTEEDKSRPGRPSWRYGLMVADD